MLRKCTFVNRARFAFAIFLILFSTFTFLTLSNEIDVTTNLAVQAIVADTIVKQKAEQYLQHRRDASSINVHTYRLARPNCTALAVGDKREIAQLEHMLYKEIQLPIPNSYFNESTKNCARFRLVRNYPEVPHSNYEAQYPVAYLVGVKEHAEQVERLLRAIYAPQNLYCLYSLNQTSSSAFPDSELAVALSLISGCFSNVIVKTTGASDNKSYRRSNRHGAPYQACLDTVLAHRDWKYLLMTAEGDFPLAINREIVDRMRQSATIWRLQRTSDHDRLLPPLTSHNDYSGYMLTRKMAVMAARGLADDTLSKLDVLREIQLLDSMKEFSTLKIRLDNYCASLDACVLKSSDLQWLMRQPLLFARKFELQTDYVVVGCLEAVLQRRQREARNESFH